MIFLTIEWLQLLQEYRGVLVPDWGRLEGALRGLSALEAIDVSDNVSLGTSGAARLLEVVGRGVKSVSLKGTGLGLAAGGEPTAPHGALPAFGAFGMASPSTSNRGVCSDDDWGRLEGALRGLSALEAIDVSGNEALGTSGVGRLVSCCAGGAFSCVTRLLRFVLEHDVVF